MTNEQALALLLQIASLAPVNKQTHMEAEKAAKQLLDVIREKENSNG